MRGIILLCFFVLLVASHLRGQLIFPLRGLFIASGISLICLVAIFSVWRELKLTKSEVLISGAYFLFLLWSALRTFTAPVPAEAYPYLGTFIEGLLVLIIVLLLFPKIHASEIFLFLFFLILLVISILKALAQYFWEFSQQLVDFEKIAGTYPERLRYGILFALKEKRVFSYYGNPNIFCGFLAMGFPTFLWFVSQKKEIKNQNIKTAFRFFLILFSLLALIVAFLTGSRGGLISLFLGGAIFYLLWQQRLTLSRRNLFLSLASLLILVFIGFGILHFWARNKGSSWRAEIRRWTNISTINQRYYYLEVAKKIIEQSPLWGGGLSSYGIFYPKFKPLEALESRYAHNFLAQIWAELGLIGLAFFLIFLFKLFALYIRNPESRIQNSESRHINSTILAAISAFLLSSLIDYTFYYREFFLDFMLLAGALTAFSLKRQREVLLIEFKFGKIIIVLMLAISFFLSLKVIFAHQLASYYQQAGLDFLREQRIIEGLKNLSRATKIEPENPGIKADYGKTLFLSGDRLRGLRTLEEAAELNPYSAYINSQIAECLVRMGFIERAIEFSEKSIALYPTNAEYHYQLAELYLKQGEKARAIQSIERALIYARHKTEKEKYKSFLEQLKKP